MIVKKNIVHLAHRRAMRALIIASVQRFKSFFVQTKFTRTLCIWTIHVSIESKSTVLLSYPQSRVNALHIVFALKNVTLVSNNKSIAVEVFDFAVSQIDNFCQNELSTVMFKLFDGKDVSLVFFSNRNNNRTCLVNCSTKSL